MKNLQAENLKKSVFYVIRLILRKNPVYKGFFYFNSFNNKFLTLKRSIIFYFYLIFQ